MAWLPSSLTAAPQCSASTAITFEVSCDLNSRRVSITVPDELAAEKVTCLRSVTPAPPSALPMTSAPYHGKLCVQSGALADESQNWGASEVSHSSPPPP